MKTQVFAVVVMCLLWSGAMLANPLDSLSQVEAGFTVQETLDLSDPISQKRLNQLARNLSGSWEHTLTQKEVDFLRTQKGEDIRVEQAKTFLTFNPDGTFERGFYCPNLNLRITEAGEWTISRDGAFLLLQVNTGQEVVEQYMRLKYLELDEMVMEQASQFVTIDMELPADDVFFTKL